MKLLILVTLVAGCWADISLLNNRQKQRPPQNAFASSGGDFLSAPKNSYIPPNNQYIPPSNQYLPPTNQYLPPQNTYLPPQTTQFVTTTRPTTQYLPPPSTYLPPQKPDNSYLPPQKPDNSYLPPQKPGNSYLPPGNQGPSTTPVPILKQTNELNEDGSFKFEFLTGDQTHVEQMGHIENPGTDNEEQVMHGSYSYVGPDGVTYKVTYVADSNGFRAIGDHLPTPPPIPEAIQQALNQNAAEEAAQGYPSGGPNQGYPSGPASQGYPSGRPTQSYLPPQNPTRPSYNPQTGYHY